jgi:RNA polymerase sigma factor (sigma-70 family)
MTEKLTSEQLTALALRARADEDALNELIAHEITYVTWWVRNRASKNYPNDVDDIVQAILIGIADGIPGFRGRSSFMTWCLSLMHNRLCDFFKRKHAIKRLMETLLWDMEEVGGTYEMLDRLESEETFNELLEMASPDGRLYLELRYGYGYKITEILDMREEYDSYDTLRMRMRHDMGYIKYELERRAERDGRAS